jgi:SAM-dependent methyltransferase
MGMRQPAIDDLYADWAQVYDLFHPSRKDEVAFWAGVARRYGERFLDLMCGTAEVSLALAREGFRVLGLDRSPAMLAIGAERQTAAADFPARSLALALGEASRLPVGMSTYDFCLVGGNGSFNHLDDELALVVLRDLARVLRSGGGLGLELVNPCLLMEIDPERTFGPLRPTPPGVRVERTVRNRLDQQSGRLEIQQVTRHKVGSQTHEFSELFELRAWQPEEFQSLMRTVGFRNVRLWGDHDKRSFDRWSSGLLILAQVS